jgi:leader peptidase (prepilin peptidase) / N-methyltransferase
VTLPVIACAAGGLVAGGLAAWWLRQGRYRREDDRPRLALKHAWVVCPLIAVAAAILGATVTGAWVAAAALYAAGGVVLGWIDMDVHRIPDRVLLWVAPVVGAAIVAGAAVEGSWAGVQGALLGAATLGVVFLVLALGSMGLGDVKLAVVTGAVLGAQGWGVLFRGTFAAFLFAGVFGVVLLVTGRAKRTDHIAFGAAIVAGAVIGMAAG